MWILVISFITSHVPALMVPGYPTQADCLAAAAVVAQQAVTQPGIMSLDFALTKTLCVPGAGAVIP